MRIEKAEGIGFCFGVKRAINILEKIAREYGGVETLGATVHNQQVLQTLTEIGVKVADNVNEIRGNNVVISSHGIAPSIEEEIRARHINIIDTTCPFVRRAQLAARRLTQYGFLVIVYGDDNHPEVKGILGWANGKGLATLDERIMDTFDKSPRRVGIISQTTQIRINYIEFIRNIINTAFIRDSELRIIDTICHDVKKRQEAALELAKKVDLMIVIGGHTSANTHHLNRLCSTITKTQLIETAVEVQPSLLKGHSYIGVTSGASTAERTIDQVVEKIADINSLSR